MFQLELSKQQLDLAEEKFSNSLIDKSSLLQEKDTYVQRPTSNGFNRVEN